MYTAYEFEKFFLVTKRDETEDHPIRISRECSDGWPIFDVIDSISK